MKKAAVCCTVGHAHSPQTGCDPPFLSYALLRRDRLPFRGRLTQPLSQGYLLTSTQTGCVPPLQRELASSWGVFPTAQSALPSKDSRWWAWSSQPRPPSWSPRRESSYSCPLTGAQSPLPGKAGFSPPQTVQDACSGVGPIHSAHQAGLWLMAPKGDRHQRM